MKLFGTKSYGGLMVAAAFLALAACNQSEPTENAVDEPDADTYRIMLSPTVYADMQDGPMAAINDCIERNNSDILAREAARTACAWAFSIPFAGSPPGFSVHLALDLPLATVTIRNANTVILITQVCIRLEFDPQHIIPAVCGSALVSPMSSGAVGIPLRSELDVAGVGPEFEIDFDTFRWDVLTVRYIELLETVAGE